MGNNPEQLNHKWAPIELNKKIKVTHSKSSTVSYSILSDINCNLPTPLPLNSTTFAKIPSFIKNSIFIKPSQ